ncbi:MmgE/PrpD family protein, partial [Thermodesulfobacteriota bacterium]
MSQKESQCSEKIAQFVHDLTFDALPGDVVTHTKQRFLELIGLFLAGSKNPATQMVSDIVRFSAGKDEATAIGLGFLTSAKHPASRGGVKS